MKCNKCHKNSNNFTQSILKQGRGKCISCTKAFNQSYYKSKNLPKSIEDDREWNSGFTSIKDMAEELTELVINGLKERDDNHNLFDIIERLLED